jgi:DNA mismatch endonuclease, patch repair protein
VTDVVDAATRSRMMAGIQGKNTKPELAVRSNLHRLGLRFTLGGHQLPGRPDLVFPRYETVVFVHGCFWHAHNCSCFRLPSSNSDFWQQKLQGNVVRDKQRIRELHALGWRTVVIWECAVRLATKQLTTEPYMSARDWIVNYDASYFEISTGRGNGFSKRRSTSRAL